MYISLHLSNSLNPLKSSPILIQLKLGPLRNPKTFFGLNEADAFGLPTSTRQFTERLQNNVFYFASNYLLFYLILVALNVITNVFCITALILVTLGWVMLGRISSSSNSDMLTIGKLPPISKNAAYMIMIVFTGVMALFMIGKLFGWSLWISITVTLVHASLRNSSDLIVSQHQLEGKIIGNVYYIEYPRACDNGGDILI